MVIVRPEIGPELPGGQERVEMLFRCGSRGQNEEGEQVAQGKPGLPGVIGAARVVHPSWWGRMRILWSRIFHLCLLQLSKGMRSLNQG